MILHMILYKIKALFLFFVNIFRRALCCFHKRRQSFSDSEQLTHVVSDQEEHNETWTEWKDDNFLNKPKTVQDYIEQYREQTIKARATTENVNESGENHNFFEDMTPKITAQPKVLIRSNENVNKRSLNSRLSAVDDSGNVIANGELGEWMDNNSGWEGEQLLDKEAQKVLREQKRLEREKKAWEQHQKRLEKASRTLGSKVTA